MTYQLYMWRSERFRDWNAGDIVICSDSEESARDIAIRQYMNSEGVKGIWELKDEALKEAEIFTRDIMQEPKTGQHFFKYGSG